MRKSKENRRVVVTGLGVVSSIGIGWQEFWKNLIAGKSGISKVEYVDAGLYDRHYAGEVKNFVPQDFIGKAKVEKLGRTSQFGIVATKLALQDAGLHIKELDLAKTGLAVGTTMGESQLIERIVYEQIKQAKDFPNSIYSLSYPASSIVSNMSIYFGFSNSNLMFANACAAGNYAVGHAYDQIREGKADIVIAGGVDSFSRIAFTGFSRVYAMSPKKCQPFDKNRKGMILGEGAGIIILESIEHAKERNANIYCETLGYGMSCDSKHMTNPSEKGIVKALKKAMASTKIKPEEVDYISAHGTGTAENDKAESQAINNVFYQNEKKIPVSSIKSMLGHAMGAAAALETIACCLAIKEGQIPPTINSKEIDPECDIDCVPNKMRKNKINVVLNNSQAFGGNNASLMFRSVI